MSEEIRLRLRRKVIRPEMSPSEKHRFVLPVRPSKMLWLPIAATLVWAVDTLGTPHLRFQYEYSGPQDNPDYLRCEYVGLHRWTMRPVDGECPLFVFLKERDV